MVSARKLFEYVSPDAIQECLPCVSSLFTVQRILARLIDYLVLLLGKVDLLMAMLSGCLNMHNLVLFKSVSLCISHIYLLSTAC